MHKQKVICVAKTSPLKAIVINKWKCATKRFMITYYDDDDDNDCRYMNMPYSFIMFRTELNDLIVNLSASHFISFFLLFFFFFTFEIYCKLHPIFRAQVSDCRTNGKSERERAKHQKQTHRRNKRRILIEIELQPIVFASILKSIKWLKNLISKHSFVSFISYICMFGL